MWRSPILDLPTPLLGGGQRYIAVDPSSISFKYTDGEKKWSHTERHD
jgi:hypothetical protein